MKASLASCSDRISSWKWDVASPPINSLDFAIPAVEKSDAKSMS
jgi:hypothetical protein